MGIRALDILFLREMGRLESRRIFGLGFGSDSIPNFRFGEWWVMAVTL